MHKHHHNSHVIFWLKSQKWTGFKLGVGSHQALCEGHTSIMSWRPGIDVAIHTEVQLLSAAAYAEFRQAVQDGLDRGAVFKRSFYGRVLWCSSITLQRPAWLEGLLSFHHSVNRPVLLPCAPVVWVSGVK